MIAVQYIYWHYTHAVRGLVAIFGNFLAGGWRLFLIGRHTRTLLGRWHRSDPNILFGSKNFSDKISNFIVDIFIRLVAAFLRLCIILVGFVYELLIIAVFLMMISAWLLWPAILIFSISRVL